ncbi:TetR/AcrR family transcriptional regulator [Ferrovum sp.]|uniref:TetR/AcrR family transcriptional regulator n=1 Tax=Ferrovum sp. TaxID=2609467 RepID=UPI00261FC903|nr:TetR/AcrR family transcriptional regulator [Ferrovum sp.]
MKQKNDKQTKHPPGARDRILHTAHNLFYREGIRATGIDRIIATAGVTKVTFYRHFPSKNDLIIAFLEYRHQLWIEWFSTELQRYSGHLGALIPVLRSWFENDDFRGCAFINSTGELGTALPQVMEMTRRHKHDMTELIQRLLPTSPSTDRDAQAIALAVDGAIIHAQFESSPEEALQSLDRILKLLGLERNNQSQEPSEVKSIGR